MLITAVISMYEAAKMLNYSFKEVISDIIKPTLCTAVMALFVYFSGIFVNKYGIVFSLIIKIIVGLVIYIVTSIILKLDGFYEVKNVIIGIAYRSLKKGVLKQNANSII